MELRLIKLGLLCFYLPLKQARVLAQCPTLPSWPCVAAEKLQLLSRELGKMREMLL